MTRTLAVVVQSVPGRVAALADTEASLRESDVGDEYEVMLHPEGLSIGQHRLGCLQRLADSVADVGLLLEDDVLVNRHLKHNLLTWPAVDEQRFGCGWLFPIMGIHDYWYGPPKKDKWVGKLAMNASLGVLFKTEDLRAWMPSFATHLTTLPQDHALASTVLRQQHDVCVHGPGLVENNSGRHGSSMGHRLGQPSLGRNWQPEWKRSV